MSDSLSTFKCNMVTQGSALMQRMLIRLVAGMVKEEIMPEYEITEEGCRHGYVANLLEDEDHPLPMGRGEECAFLLTRSCYSRQVNWYGAHQT